MILAQLVKHRLKHGDDTELYRIQARDSIKWMESRGVCFGPGTTVLDIGCGLGVFGGMLIGRGCTVEFADFSNGLLPELAGNKFHAVDLNYNSLITLGQFDVVICSNVLEHLHNPTFLLSNLPSAMKADGCFYLSWTNWLSPWGGHEFSPFHYLGTVLGPHLFDVFSKKRFHVVLGNLFPTYIGAILRFIKKDKKLRIFNLAPRYYTELSWISRIPILREFLSWNCVIFGAKQ